MRRIVIIVSLFVCFSVVAVAGAGAVTKATNYEKSVARDMIKWFQNTEVEGKKLAYLKKQVLKSNFHASLGATTYGSFLDFIVAMGKIYPVNSIEVAITDFKIVETKPYSIYRPLVSCHFVLTVIYEPHEKETLAYSFKLLYYSDIENLKKLAVENDFPNVESMDKNTYLIMIKEEVTDNFPDDFVAMDPAAFKTLLATPVNVVFDYIDLDK